MVSENNKYDKNDKLITFALIVLNFLIFSLLGIVIFLLFVVSNVKAETYDNNLYYIMTINQGYGVGNNAYNVNSISFNSTTDWGYQWRPYKSTGTYWAITKSDYMIDISWNIATSIIQTYNHLTNNLPTVYMQVQGVQATCDGNETLAVINQAQISSTYWTTYRYTCSLLNVTQDFNWFQFSVTHPLLRYGTPAFTQMSINYTSIIDKNDLSTDADAIISNNNQNTQRIIDGINGLEGSIGNVNSNLINIDDLLSDNSISNYGGVFNNIHFNSTGAVSGIISAPLSAITDLLSHTCSDLVLPLPFVNENLTLPCMDTIYNTHFGSFYTLYQTIILGITAYWVCLNFFKLVKGFSEPMEDRIEVLDL